MNELLLLSIKFLFSISCLLLGSNWALDSAEAIGQRIKLPPLVIGVVFIGFGTSLPELFVSQIACLQGKPLVSMGNILGSNISNLALILGLSALIVNMPINSNIQRKQIYSNLFIVILFSVIYYLFDKFNVVAGLFLIAFFAFYLVKIVLKTEEAEEAVIKEVESSWKDYPKFLSSVALMYFGGEYLVKSTLEIGQVLQVSEYVISVIALALGTSAPELFTAMLACYKKKNLDYIMGNLMGSNAFNMTLILGSTGFYDFDLKLMDLRFEIIILLVLSLYLLAQSFLRKNLGKRAGVVFLTLYGVSIWHWVQQ